MKNTTSLKDSVFTVKERLYLILILLHVGNAIVIVFMYLLMRNATALICSSFDAREFLERLQYIPKNPDSAGLLSLIFFILFCLIELYRYFSDTVGARDWDDFILFFIYLFLGLGSMYYLNMGNKDILLLSAIHAVLYIQSKRRKFIALSIVFFLYIFLDHDLISSIIRLVPFDSYIEYYPATEKIRFYAIRSLLFSFNEVLFLVFMILYIQKQAAEHKRVQELNKKLHDSLQSLEAANIQLSEYAKKSEDMAKLKERNRLAREIHDTIGHTLTGIEMGIKACLCYSHDKVEELFDMLAKVHELALKGIRDVRFSLKELRPDALQRYSLIPALEQLIKQMNECTHTNSYLTLESCMPKIIATQEELIYRIVQESITNSISHGNATEIEIRIDNDGHTLFISICDNGRGCPNLKQGFGLTNIQERVEYFKGSVSIKTAFNKGFGLHIQLPLIRTPAYD